MPGEFSTYLSWSHAWPSICVVLKEEEVVCVAGVELVVVVVTVAEGVAAVLVVSFGLMKETAPPDDALVFVHAVLT